MFRDRLRLWHMNKNQRSAANRRRRALQLANDRGNNEHPESQNTPVYRSSPQPTMPNRGNLQNVLHTPNETLILQRTLKGILDWQQNLEDPLVDPKHSSGSASTFSNLINNMVRCLCAGNLNPLCRGKLTPQLRSTSAKLQSLIRVICTPLAILRAVGVLSSLVIGPNYDPWYHETSRFLVNAAVEAFPDSHPSLLLLQLLFSEPTPSQLAMVYEAGSSMMQRFRGDEKAFTFCVAMHALVFKMGLGATFRSSANDLCASMRDSNDAARFYKIAKLHLSMGSYDECSAAAQKSLAQLDAEGNKRDLGLINTLWVLANSQQKQQDFTGEESSVRRILDLVLATDRRRLRSSQLSVDALEAISRMDEFYECHQMNEQRDALHLEFPSAFEL